MAYTPLYGTGFESGTLPVPSTEYSSSGRVGIATNPVKTGVYSLQLRGVFNGLHGWIRFAVTDTPSEVYVSAWCRPDTQEAGGWLKIRVYVDSGHYVDLRYRYTNTWDAYVNGAWVASGTIVTSAESWQHVQVRFSIDNSGAIQSKIDGIDDIDYSGDTQPGATNNISHVYLWQQMNAQPAFSPFSYVDDFTFGTDDWSDDIRFDGLVVDGDVTTEWTPSAGSSHYALLDEKPADTGDYISTGSGGITDRFTLADWSGTAKSPQFLMAWVHGKKDAAGSRTLNIIAHSGGSTLESGATDLYTTDRYYHSVLATEPSTGSLWTNDLINDLELSVVSG